MQFGLYRTTPLAAAARLSSVLKLSLPGKMTTNRGMKSSPDGRKSLTDNEQGQPSIFSVEEFPPLSATKSIPCSKTINKIDLSTTSEQRTEAVVVQNIDPFQFEASTSINDPYDTSLPGDFVKKAPPSSFTRKPNPRQNYHERETSKRNSSFSRGTDINEPFDICFTKPFEYSFLEFGKVLRPGMVLFKSYIPLSEQVEIVKRCQELGRGPGGFYRPGYEDGAKLRLYMMCLGLDWNAQTRKYGDIRQHDNVVPPLIPDEFTSLVTKALDDSHSLIKRNFRTENVEDILPKMSPDVCIVNFYNTNGRLGLHQDRDESRGSLRKGLPVVSVSVGDSAEFLYGDKRDADVADRVLLESGDVVIFGGESRHIFHGVKSIIPNSAPRELLENTKLRPGRLNLTFRKY